MKVASAVPYTDDIGGSVVAGLVNMASIDQLLPHIPLVARDWLKQLPVLPPEYAKLLPSPTESAVRGIHQFGGAKLIALYLHTIWSEERKFWYDDIQVMRRLTREELGGIGAAGYRTDLILRLDHVLLRLDQGHGVRWMKAWYEELRRELLEVDEKATNILTGMSSNRRPFFVY